MKIKKGPLQDWLRLNGRFFFISTIILFCSFMFNVSGAMKSDSFLQNYKDSESLVVSAISCKGSYAGGLLAFNRYVGADSQYNCDTPALSPYYSQFGLQGRVYTFGFKLFDGLFGIGLKNYILLAQFLTALVSAMCFALMAVWANNRYGKFVGVFFVIAVSISPMVVGFARNLYWALPLMIAPILFTLYAYKVKAKESSRILFWVGIFLLLYARWLCGYEYVTTITLAVFATTTLYLYEASSSVKQYFKEALTTCLVAVLAFSAALGTHILNLSSYTGSTQSAVKIVKERALERTLRGEEYTKYASLGLKSNLSEIYVVADGYIHFEKKQGSLFWAVVAAAINYLFMPVLNLPLALKEPLGALVQSMLIFITILAVVYIKRHRLFAKKALRQAEALLLSSAIGLCGYLSWLILASSHSLVHAHINGILQYLPFALFGYIVMGMALRQAISSMKISSYVKRTK